jgi:hypothetical protein
VAPGMGAIVPSIRAVLMRAPVEPFIAVDTMVRDILGLTRGMTDMAGQAEETDVFDLERRICKALFGYLCESLMHA